MDGKCNLHEVGMKYIEKNIQKNLRKTTTLNPYIINIVIVY
jgi:hypothetical protein